MPDWLQNLQYEVQMMSAKRNLIIAVDFDGTLCHCNWPGVGEPNRILIDKLLKLQRNIKYNRRRSHGHKTHRRKYIKITCC